MVACTFSMLTVSIPSMSAYNSVLYFSRTITMPARYRAGEWNDGRLLFKAAEQNWYSSCGSLSLAATMALLFPFGNIWIFPRFPRVANSDWRNGTNRAIDWSSGEPLSMIIVIYFSITLFVYLLRSAVGKLMRSAEHSQNSQNSCLFSHKKVLGLRHHPS